MSVTYTPRGGVAVVRASQHFPDPILGPKGHADQIALVNPINGIRLTFADALKCSEADALALTRPDNAGNLVAASETRAVLIGQHHLYSGPFAGEVTVVNVVDLTDAFGNPLAQPPGGPRCMLSWPKADAGYVSDVAITPDGRFAVVNHKGWISVFQIDQATVPAPAEFDTSGGIPTRQVRSLAMTRSTVPSSPVKCVAVTARLVNGKRRVWAYVLDLSGAAPALEAEIAINLSNPDDDNPPHDVRLTPDETMAIVCADGVVAMIDLTAGPALLRGEFRDVDAERDYESLADSLAVTNTQVVALSAERGSLSGAWQADVFDIASGHSGGMVLKHTENGVNRPHDLARSNDGETVVIRTKDAVVFLDDIDEGTASISRFDIASVSGPLNNFVPVHDTVVVSRAWVMPAFGGEPGGPRHYAAVIGHDLNQAVPATRVEVFDLTPLKASTSLAPVPVLSEVLFDPAYDGARPASIQLHPGGQSFVVRTNAAPHNLDPTNWNVGYDPATGEDVWYFSLQDQPGVPGKDPIGSVFQYEMTASPRSVSDPLDVARYNAVNISSNYTLDVGDLGFVHTISIVE